MNTIKTAVKTGVFVISMFNAPEVFATIANPDSKKLDAIQTPVMNGFVEEHTEEIADTLIKPKRELKIQATELEKEITSLNQELEQKKEEYRQKREEFKEKYDQDSVDITLLVDSIELYRNKLIVMETNMETYEERKEALEKFSKDMDAKVESGKKKTKKETKQYDSNAKEYDEILKKIQKLTNDYGKDSKTLVTMKNRSDLMRINYNDRQSKLDNSKKEISDLEQKVADKVVELSKVNFTLEHYDRLKRNSKAKK